MAAAMAGGTEVEEMLEVTDAGGVPTGELVARPEAHARGVLHKTVYVLVRSRDGRVLLQRRHASKSICPGLWDLSCAEHMHPGETYEAAARRGLHEELALVVAGAEGDGTLPLTERLAPSVRTLEVTNARGVCIVDAELVPLYEAVVDSPEACSITPDGVEVSQVRWTPWDDVLGEMRTEPHAFTPWFLLTAFKMGDLAALPPFLDAHFPDPAHRART